MNVDFRVLRRSALGVCGVALMGFTLEGCVSCHKPRFWDKDDVTSTTNANGGQPATTPPADPSAAKAAPTVVVADHTSADNSSGAVSAFDFPDSTPNVSGGGNTAASGSPPASPSKQAAAGSNAFTPLVPPNAANDAFDDPHVSAPAVKQAKVANKGNDPFAETAASPPSAPVAPATKPAIANSAVTDAGPSATLSHSADPFADSDSPAFLGPAPSRAAAEPAKPADAAPASSSPEPAPPQAASISPTPVQQAQPAPTQTQTVAAQVQPTSQAPVWSGQPAPQLPDEPSEKITPSAPPQAAPGAPPVGGPYEIPAGPAPVPTVGAAQNNPTCAAPAAMAPAANAGGWQGAPSGPAKPAASAASLPARSPASTEQVSDTEAWASASQAPQVVVPAVGPHAASKAGASPGVPRAAAHLGETSTHPESELNDAARPTIPTAVIDSMICESKSVRGRFTGTAPATPKASQQSPPKEAPPKEAPQQSPAHPVETPPFPATAEPAPSPPAAPPSEPSPPAAAPPASQSPGRPVPMSSLDGDEAPASRTGHELSATPKAHESALKPKSGVVNAVAQQVGHAPAAHPFSLEQTVDTSGADAFDIADAPHVATADAPQPFDAFSASGTPAASQSLLADTSMVANPAPLGMRIASETWFAIGLALGLAAGLAWWLHSRPRKRHLVHG